MGDWNETCFGTSTSAKLCREFGLVDIWSHHHPEEEFNTYLRGSRRIDFAITTHELAEKANMIYEPFFQRLSGDHRGFYIDFQEQDLFMNTNLPIFESEGRRLKSKDKSAVTQYINHLHQHLLDNNVFKRMDELLKNKEANHSEAEIIDRETTRGGSIC